MEDHIPEPEVQSVLDEIERAAPMVGILMGDESEREIMSEAADELDRRGILYETKVLSAFGDPDGVREYAVSAEGRGLKVLIAGSAQAGGLPGLVAAFTELPVVGVPIKTPALAGLDSLLATAQMPYGTPVACMAVDGSRNAAILAARILSLCFPAGGAAGTTVE